MDLNIDPALALGLRLVLAFVLVSAAAHKMEDVAAFKAVLQGYGLVPSIAMPAAPFGLALVELTIAAGVLLFPLSVAAATSAGVLFTAYGGVMAATILRGRRDLDCGCGARNLPLGWSLVFRNCVLVAVSLTAATPQSIAGLNWLGWVTVVFVAGFGILFHLAAETLLANHARMNPVEVRS